MLCATFLCSSWVGTLSLRDRVSFVFRSWSCVDCGGEQVLETRVAVVRDTEATFWGLPGRRCRRWQGTAFGKNLYPRDKTYVIVVRAWQYARVPAIFCRNTGRCFSTMFAIKDPDCGTACLRRDAAVLNAGARCKEGLTGSQARMRTLVPKSELELKYV